MEKPRSSHHPIENNGGMLRSILKRLIILFSSGETWDFKQICRTDYKKIQEEGVERERGDDGDGDCGS